MELKDIVSIAGVSGLHKIIGRSKTGLILETIGTGKRFATSVQDKVSVLEDISMFTEGDDMKLAEVLVNLNEKEKNNEAVPDVKADLKTVREFLSGAIKIDNERVYDSDIKKLISWYHLLKADIDFEKLKAAATEEPAEGAEDLPKHTEAKKTVTPKAPKNMASKHSSKGSAGSQMTYRPKSGT